MMHTRNINVKQHAKYVTLNLFSSNEAGVQSLYDIFTHTLGFDSIENKNRNEVSVTDGYCRINFWSNNRVSAIRNALSKPNITRLSSMILHDPCNNNNNVDSDDSNNNVFNETFQKWKLCVGNSPKLNTELRNSKRSINDDDSSVDIGHRPLLKEIVLGLTSTEDYNRYSDHLFQCLPYANEKCPGIFSVSSNKLFNIRLLPSKTSSLVFHVNDIQEAEKQLNMVNMNGGRIGYTGASHGQLMLKTPLQDGVDIRLCSKVELEPHFCEGEQAVYEGVIKGFGDVAHTSQLGCGHILRKEIIGKAMSDKL